MSAEVIAALPASLRNEFEAGKTRVKSLEKVLSSLVAISLEELTNEFVDAKSQLDAEISGRRQSIQKTSEQIAKTQRERRQAHTEASGKLQLVAFQMANVGQRAGFVTQALAGLSVPQPQVSVRDVGPTYTSSASDRHSSRKNSPVIQEHIPVYQTYLRPETICERQVRLNQFHQMLSQMQHIETQATKLCATARELQAKRSAVMAQHSEVVASLNANLRETRRVTRDLTRELQALERQHHSLITLKALSESLLAYVAWDVELDRAALMKSYMQPVK